MSTLSVRIPSEVLFFVGFAYWTLGQSLRIIILELCPLAATKKGALILWQ